MSYDDHFTFDKTNLGSLLNDSEREFMNEINDIYSKRLILLVCKGKNVKNKIDVGNIGIEDRVENILTNKHNDIDFSILPCDQNPRRIHLELHHKLRSYALFKSCFQYKRMEPYLIYIDIRNRYSLLARLRMGTLPLRIETGRYEAVTSFTQTDAKKIIKGIPVIYRICRCCTLNKIEDEIHFLLECPFYENLRIKLLNICEQHIGNFMFETDVGGHVINSINTFSNIMGTDKKEVIIALSQFVWFAYSKRFKHLRTILTV